MSIYYQNKVVAGVGRNTVRNAHNLLDFKWSDHRLNSMEWLESSSFSWQAGSVYLAVYNHLVADATGKTLQSETVAGVTIQFYLADDGHKICPASEESNVASIYSATGVAWYYILDTANTRFKLPRTKFGFTGLRDTVGKYIEAGLPNITGAYAIIAQRQAEADSPGALYGSGSQTAYNGGNNKTTNPLYITLDASRSSSIYGNSNTVQPPATQMYLYFYVGQYTQSAIEQTAGITTEQLNQKLDLDAGNATSSTKETVVGWGMPDYSAGVTISALPFTAPTDGILYICMYITSDYYDLLVNDIRIANGGGSNNDRNAITILLSKNDVVTKGSKGSVSVAIFFPSKGVN